MVVRLHVLLGIGIAVLTMHSAATFGQAMIKKVTVCELLASRDAYDGELVSASVRIESDLLERTFIVDEACLNLGSIDVRYGGSPLMEKHLSALTAALAKAHNTSTESHRRTVIATVVGKFHKTGSETSSAILRISDATSIRVVERPPILPIPPKAE